MSRSLGEQFIRTARKKWSCRYISDSTGRQLNFGQTLISAVALGAEIDRLTVGQEKIGILLPSSVGGALANLAVTMSGKVPVNLNYVTSEEVIVSAVEQCGIKSIISSRSFAEKVGHLDSLPGLIFLEDIVAKMNRWSKIRAYLKARFIPRKILANVRVRSDDDLAAIIFSSGTSGQPKGIMLSHRNILSNIESLLTVFRLEQEDNLCGVLPFFHSFGFSCSLWLPLIGGVSASYTVNPLDGRAVGETVRRNRSTLLFAAPTFLLNYIRRVESGDFSSLRVVVTGAEKLRKHIADSFEAKFGIRPLEGYGVTELSPAVSLNLTEAESTGLYRVGSKEGTVGFPIPAVEVKIVSLDDGREVAVGTSGLLMVKGPSVMLGYLNNEKETDRVLKDGWYNTGDVGSIDENGFLTITDRLSRFSKIGGEMVPHLGLEEVYLRGLETDEQVVAVTGVPEHKKGEELVVLYLEEAGSAKKLRKIIAKSKLPNMWKPRRNNYIRIESMPALGSGKLDIVRLREIALDAKKSSVHQRKIFSWSR